MSNPLRGSIEYSRDHYSCASRADHLILCSSSCSGLPASLAWASHTRLRSHPDIDGCCLVADIADNMPTFPPPTASIGTPFEAATIQSGEIRANQLEDLGGVRRI